MKQKYVPLDKRSRREQKEFYAAQRKDWNGVNPVTRTAPNLKAYNRKRSEKKSEQWNGCEPPAGFFYWMRDMSLSIGQGPAYINSIENKKAMPSMRGFLYICDYLNISPKDFFDVDSSTPELLSEIVMDMKSLTMKQLTNIANIIKDLKNTQNISRR